MTLPDPDGAGSQPAPVSTFAYDAAGRLIATARTDVQALAAAQPPLEQASYAYDGLGRLVARADFRGTLTSTYDAGVRLTATTDRLGRVTSYAYDALDRPTRVTAPDPDGNPATSNTPVWAFAYDAAGQQRLAIDPAGARTATAYDDAGAVALVRDPVGSATRFARDAVGNLIRVTDPLGNTTTTTFDALDRPVREQVSFTAADRTFAYDAAGNLDRVKDRNGRVIDFDADNLGRTTAEKWLPVGGTTPIRTLTSTYTATGQPQGVVDSDVVDSSFTYDALDRPVSETTSLHGPLAPSTPFAFTLTSTYDAADRRTGLADSRGGLATYGYDGAGRMTSASLGAGGVAGPAVTLGYDANDRLTDIGRRVGTAGRSILSRLTYDAAGRLITVAHADSADTAWGGDTPLASFEDTLDAAGRVTSTIGTNRTGAQETRSYGYDAAGQIVSQAVTGQPTTSFAYDAAGNRTAGTTIQPGNRLAEDATYRYVYDAEGNLTRREEKASTRVREYAWDHRNRLTTVTDRDTAAGPATQQVSFVYDAFDRRVGKIVDVDGAGPLSATKRWTMYDGQDAYADLDGAGAVQSRYLHGPAVDLLLGRLDADGQSTWYLPDRLGSTRALARIGSTSAQVLDRIDYDAFGTASESAPTAGDRFKFTGREYDAETGLYYYRARYYDAGTGRFVGEDPSGFAGGDANLYRYVGNSPTNLVDPSGLKAAKANPVSGTVEGWHTELAGHVIPADARGPGPSVGDELGIVLGNPGASVAGALSSLWDSLIGDTIGEAQTVWGNTEGMGFGSRLYATAGTTLGSMVGVRQISDAFSTHDAVDGHEQSTGERVLDGLMGPLQLAMTAWGLSRPVLSRPARPGQHSPGRQNITSRVQTQERITIQPTDRLAATRGFRSVSGVDEFDRLAIDVPEQLQSFLSSVEANGWIVKESKLLGSSSPAYFFPRKGRFYYDPERLSYLDLLHEESHLESFVKRGNWKLGRYNELLAQDEVAAYTRELQLLSEVGGASSKYMDYLERQIHYYRRLPETLRGMSGGKP